MSYAALLGNHLANTAGKGWQVIAGHPGLVRDRFRDAKTAGIKRLIKVYAAGLDKSGVELVNTLIAGDQEFEAAAIWSRPATAWCSNRFPAMLSMREFPAPSPGRPCLCVKPWRAWTAQQVKGYTFPGNAKYRA